MLLSSEVATTGVADSVKLSSGIEVKLLEVSFAFRVDSTASTSVEGAQPSKGGGSGVLKTKAMEGMLVRSPKPLVALQRKYKI